MPCIYLCMMVMQSKSETELYQVTWIILNAVKHLHVGKIKLAAFLKGSKSKKIKPIAGEAVYGGLMWHDIATITGFIEQLENMNLIKRKSLPGYPYDYSVLELTDAGKLVLEEKRQIPLQIIKEIKPITVGDSEKETYWLMKQGKKIQEIAQERNLALSTIYSHIFRLILNGYLSSSEVVSQDIVNKVAEAAQKLSEPTVKQLKELLPEISYDEIRCALAEIKRDKDEG